MMATVRGPGSTVYIRSIEDEVARLVAGEGTFVEMRKDPATHATPPVKSVCEPVARLGQHVVGGFHSVLTGSGSCVDEGVAE
jgi:hypothetical protein